MAGPSTCILRPLGRLFLAIALAAGLLGGPLEAQTPAAVTVANGGFEAGNAGEPPPQWGGTVARSGRSGGDPVYRAVIDDERPRQGRASARLERIGAQPGPSEFGVLTSRIDAQPFRGRRIRLTGAVRTEIEAGTQVGLWLRVDRPRQLPGFFDNMRDRPIRGANWADYVIEGDVAADAEHIYLGMILAGAGRAWLDDVRIEDVGPARNPTGAVATIGPPRREAGPGDEPARALTERGLANLHAFARLYGLIRFFHPSDEAAEADWSAIALAGIASTEGAQSPSELAAALNAIFQPVAPSFRTYVTGTAAPPEDDGATDRGVSAVRWRHVGMGTDMHNLYGSTRETVAAVGEGDVLTEALPGGVSVRVPRVVWRDAQGATLPRATAALPATGKPDEFIPAGFDRTTRLAAATAAWSMFQHFYPYFDVVDVDWNAELHRALRSAAVDADDRAFHATLRRLVAALQDGHGMVLYPSEERATLPIAWDWVEGQLVVTRVGEGVEGVARGDVVTHVGGIPVGQALDAQVALNSGSPQWTRFRGLVDLLTGPRESGVELILAGRDGGSRSVRLTYRMPPNQPLREARPGPVTELAPGIVYVNLDGLPEEQYRAHDDEIAEARGLIFDLRGYPAMPPIFLQHLADGPFQSPRFDRAVHLRPDHQAVTYLDGGWDMSPVAPRYTRNVVFIINGEAISYAESVLGTIAANNFATIVGEPSAGANGNVASFDVPGGYRLAWTGMRVLNRDGSRHHVVGVRPDVPVSRTLAGIRAGRDEQLERALELVRARLEEGGGAD